MSEKDVNIHGKKEKEIIINRMFSGEYLKDERNIGHEIINLFACDSDCDDNPPRHYIYLVPNGEYSANHIDYDVEGILLARGVSAERIEILGVATGISKIFDPENFEKKSDKRFKDYNPPHRKSVFSPYGWRGLNSDFEQMGLMQVDENGAAIYSGQEKLANKRYAFKFEHDHETKYIRDNNIKYGGLFLDELFENNREEYGLAFYLTYQAESVKTLNSRVFLITKHDEEINFEHLKPQDCDGVKYYISGTDIYIPISRGRLSGSSMATFYRNNEESYNTLAKLIEYYTYNGKEITTQVNLNERYEDTDSFLTLIRKEHDELSYSNMFAYFFEKYPRFLEYFAKEALNIKNTRSTLLIKTEVDLSGKKEKNQDEDNKGEKTVYREKKNIDLLIKMSSANGKVIIIAIENKIKSGINGIKHDINGKIVQNQLDKYYNFIMKEYSNGEEGEDVFEHHFYIFAPDYNEIDERRFERESQKKWLPIIRYGRIHEVVERYYQSNKSELLSDPYFLDFIKALKRHAGKKDVDYELMMKKKMSILLHKHKTNNSNR